MIKYYRKDARNMSFGKDDIIKYVRDRFGTKPEYLWSKYPDCCVLRNAGSGKWYAIFQRISGEKLGVSGEIKNIVNFKCGSALLGSLLDKPGYFPAYHMSKEHWVTVLLDGGEDREEIINLINISYASVEKKIKPGKKRTAAAGELQRADQGGKISKPRKRIPQSKQAGEVKKERQKPL